MTCNAWSEAESEPFDGHMTLPRAAYLAAHRAGIKVMLDGVAGDVVLGAGNLMPRLLRRGHWRHAWREMKGERRFWGPYEAVPGKCSATCAAP